MEILRVPGSEDLPLPAYHSLGASGLDLCAASDATIKPGEYHLVRCGISIALPEGYEAQVRPRSGLALDHGITVLNAPGTIDHDYRGEIGALLINHGKTDFYVARGARIAQLVVAPVCTIEWAEVSRLPTTLRGSVGYGGTGLA
jgi:dUTP pyrophosphatase